MVGGGVRNERWWRDEVWLLEAAEKRLVGRAVKGAGSRVNPTLSLSSLLSHGLQPPRIPPIMKAIFEDLQVAPASNSAVITDRETFLLPLSLYCWLYK